MVSAGVHDVHPGNIRGGCYFSLVFFFVSILGNGHTLLTNKQRTTKTLLKGVREEWAEILIYLYLLL